MKNKPDRVRISFAAQAKPAPVAGFIIFNENSARSVPSIFNYRKPRLVKAQKGWYIEYYYRIPMDVREMYDNKEWYRFRETEDMNRRRGAEKIEYAEWLLSEITDMLRRGYNPFKIEKQFKKDEAHLKQEDRELNATDALLLFLETWSEKGLDPSSLAKYKRYVHRLIAWLLKKKIPYIEISGITSDHIEQFLSETKKENGLSNREYNNHFDFIRTAFNFLLKKKYISESPCANFTKQKTKSTKHRFYDGIAMEKITKAFLASDKYCYLAFQTVYYLCVRSGKELFNMKIGNIQWDQNRILLEVSKTDQRYVPMDENIKEILMNYTADYPDHYYLFGPWEKPSDKPANYTFFAKRFVKVRELAQLPDEYTMYGAKHTRVIHLKQDGASDADIMSLTGHKDFVAYSKYLRDLGMDADAAKLSKLSRKL